MSGQRELSEPGAWREIARRMASGQGRGINGEIHRMWCTLCYRQGIALPMDRYSGQRLWRRFVEHTARTGTSQIPRLRSEWVLAALFLALEAEDEIKARPSPCANSEGENAQ